MRAAWISPLLALLAGCSAPSAEPAAASAPPPAELASEHATPPAAVTVRPGLGPRGGGPAAGIGTFCLGSPPPPFDDVPALGRDDMLDETLARAGLERRSFGLTSDALALSRLDTKDKRILRGVHAGLRAPARLPDLGRRVSQSLDDALASRTPVTSAILAAAVLRDTPIDVCANVALETHPTPLASELAVAPQLLEGVPSSLQAALVPIARAIREAIPIIHAARARAGSDAFLTTAAAVPPWLIGVRHFEWVTETPEALERIDSGAILAAGAAIALAVERADLARFRGVVVPDLDLDTAIGPVVLRGPQGDLYPATRGEAPTLLIDTGGHDVYLAPVAAATLGRPVSVAIDLAGDDRYTYEEARDTEPTEHALMPADAAGRAGGGRTLSRAGRQGSATLGVGLLFDLGGGRDRYQSLVASQGAASHGVGVLYDDGGDDRYESEGFSQGAGAWGIGLLLDRSGNDHYSLHHAGQGYGFTRGVGAIVDEEGNDEYVADPGPIVGGNLLYPSDQMPGEANHSFAQGCGAGHRPDWPDPGFPFPGGFGLVRDAAGNDRYAAGIFAQGSGFVEGAGALLDGSGDDVYEGLYYVGAAAAHVGVALFVDDAGDDSYNPTFPIAGPSLGVAHDLSVAVHVDGAGSDRYRASWGAFGAGLANGVALFVAAGGDDRFEALGTLSLGAAWTADVRPERTELPTIGVFARAGGRSTYVIDGKLEDRADRSWTQPGSSVEIGLGVDRPRGRLSL
ncbi:MAG: hypothetical protein JST00_23780 [Deltaproteobacteria bacterium]|nr:hypothetical protein [Deltaproteobacteria bacterium]